MSTASWPLRELRLRASGIELKLPSEAELDLLAELAADGVHDPEEMPFAWPWTDQPAEGRARSTRQASFVATG